MDLTQLKIKAAEVQGRLSAYADTNDTLGFYTEAKCGWDAVAIISSLLEEIGRLEDAAKPKPKPKEKKTHCGHCGKEFRSLIPGSRCRTLHCEAPQYWNRDQSDA